MLPQPKLGLYTFCVNEMLLILCFVHILTF
ncbi:Uncharacterised protein [Vibrio cholerae]|nr:Uncharacterised protein [Vibrio cholerae]